MRAQGQKHIALYCGRIGALKHICPDQGGVLGDKGYAIQPAQTRLARKGCRALTIKRRSMKNKNKDKDRWLSACRAPDERVFSKISKRARYGGIAKNQFQVFMQALANNLKRLVNLKVETLVLNSV